MNDEEARALVFVRELGAIDNAAYRAINRTDTLNASTRLRRLRDMGLLAMKGSGSSTYYVPGPPMHSGVDAGAANTPQPAPNTHQLAPNTHQSTPNTHQPDTNTHQLMTQMPPALRERIPAVGTKPRRTELSQLVRDLCAWQPLSARTLAVLLNRQDHKHLVREILSPMVTEGLLVYTIPEMENHPDQRYTLPVPPAPGAESPAP